MSPIRCWIFCPTVQEKDKHSTYHTTLFYDGIGEAFATYNLTPSLAEEAQINTVPGCDAICLFCDALATLLEHKRHERRHTCRLDSRILEMNEGKIA